MIILIIPQRWPIVSLKSMRLIPTNLQSQNAKPNYKMLTGINTGQLLHFNSQKAKDFSQQMRELRHAVIYLHACCLLKKLIPTCFIYIYILSHYIKNYKRFLLMPIFIMSHHFLHILHQKSDQKLLKKALKSSKHWNTQRRKKNCCLERLLWSYYRMRAYQ